MHYKRYKSILSPKNGMNIYRGCSHGCIYCDSRSECYRMEHDFEDIEIKQDAPVMLENELKKRRKRCMIGTGSMCDPYLPLEKEIKYTRACLEVIERYGFGVTVITKSDLVLRDIDLYKRINQKSRCVVQMTLTTADEELCRIIEPGVCTTKRRYEVLKTLHENSIPTVVWLCPILPFINDTEENLLKILEYCFDAGVSGILNFGIGVTLRAGDREYFYAALDKHFPGMKQRYIERFGDSYSINSDNNAALMRIFHQKCRERGVIHDTRKVFEFLDYFPEKEKQLSLFDIE